MNGRILLVFLVLLGCDEMSYEFSEPSYGEKRNSLPVRAKIVHVAEDCDHDQYLQGVESCEADEVECFGDFSFDQTDYNDCIRVCNRPGYEYQCIDSCDAEHGEEAQMVSHNRDCSSEKYRCKREALDSACRPFGMRKSPGLRP